MTLLPTPLIARHDRAQRRAASRAIIVFVTFACVISAIAPPAALASTDITTATAAPQPVAPIMSDGWRFVQTDGAALYRATCQGCHMPQGQGAHGAGMYPALANNPRVSAATYVAYTVLKGRKGMPGFAWSMSDAQVAEVVNYVRSNFGNLYAEPIDAAEVGKLR